MKITFQHKNRHRSIFHGFSLRMITPGGIKFLDRRRKIFRKVLTAYLFFVLCRNSIIKIFIILNVYKIKTAFCGLFYY
ncbi:MAG: 50S ribosomal protein L34 [Lachnospirales bacterium]